MKNFIIVAILISFIGMNGCATKNIENQNQFIVNIAPIDPIIIYDSGELHDAIQKFSQVELKSVGEINLLDVPVFNRLRKMEFMPLNRSYAIGFPHTVGGSYANWNYNNPKTSAYNALQDCLTSVKDRESHLSEKVGAQLVLWNNYLLVSPDKLPTSFYVPYVVRTTTKSGESDISHGMFQYEGPGTNLKFKLYDNNEKVVGEGTYSLTLLQAAFDTGSFKMMYHPLSVEIEGRFITEKIKLRHKEGYLRISKGNAALPDGGEIKFFTGLPIDHLKYYRYLLE